MIGIGDDARQPRRIEDAVLIGMGAIVLDGAVVRKHGFVGAGALVAPGKVVGEGELWLGNPATKVRMLSDAEIESKLAALPGWSRAGEAIVKVTPETAHWKHVGFEARRIAAPLTRTGGVRGR